jgi:hypothetical protein
MALSFPTKCGEDLCATVKAESFVPHPAKGGRAMRKARGWRYKRYKGERGIHLAFILTGARLAGRRASAVLKGTKQWQRIQ